MKSSARTRSPEAARLSFGSSIYLSLNEGAEVTLPLQASQLRRASSSALLLCARSWGSIKHLSGKPSTAANYRGCVKRCEQAVGRCLSSDRPLPPQPLPAWWAWYVWPEAWSSAAWHPVSITSKWAAKLTSLRLHTAKMARGGMRLNLQLNAEPKTMPTSTLFGELLR